MNFSIQQCNFLTDRKYNLQQHKVIHTKEELFKFDTCTKYNSREGDLNRRANTHDEEPKNKCNFFESSSTRRDNLKEHQISNHTKSFLIQALNAEKFL